MLDHSRVQLLAPQSKKIAFRSSDAKQLLFLHPMLAVAMPCALAEAAMPRASGLLHRDASSSGRTTPAPSMPASKLFLHHNQPPTRDKYHNLTQRWHSIEHQRQCAFVLTLQGRTCAHHGGSSDEPRRI